MTRFRDFIFRLFERRTLRDWFYTIAFVIFVPVGYRFAELAWRYGSWVDKPLAVIAGIFIGITTVVTLLRFWNVPPRLVVTPSAPTVATPPKSANSPVNEYMAEVHRRAAQNRAMATSAGALGSTMGKGSYRL